jgi:catechol 2,3-dioxygenase-like lactoylglutathione lyase family enzyme
MLKLAIPVLHVTRSEAGEEFYCDKLGFRRESRAIRAGATGRCTYATATGTRSPSSVRSRTEASGKSSTGKDAAPRGVTPTRG